MHPAVCARGPPPFDSERCYGCKSTTSHPGAKPRSLPKAVGQFTLAYLFPGASLSVKTTEETALIITVCGAPVAIFACRPGLETFENRYFRGTRLRAECSIGMGRLVRSWCVNDGTGRCRFPALMRQLPRTESPSARQSGAWPRLGRRCRARLREIRLPAEGDDGGVVSVKPNASMDRADAARSTGSSST